MNLSDIYNITLSKNNYIWHQFLSKFAITFPFVLLAEVNLIIFSFTLLLFLDTVLGTMYAIKTQTFQLSRFKQVFLKAFLYFSIIIAARLVEYSILGFYETTKITEVVILFICFTEFLSILEKMALFKLPIPKKELLYKVMFFFKLETAQKMILHSELKQEIDRDMRLLTIKYIKIAKTKKVREFLSIHFNVWENFMLTDLFAINYSKNTADVMLEINMLFRKSTDLVISQLNKNKKFKTLLPEYLKILDTTYTNRIEEIEKILNSDMQNETKALRIASTFVSSQYKVLNNYIE